MQSSEHGCQYQSGFAVLQPHSCAASLLRLDSRNAAGEPRTGCF